MELYTPEMLNCATGVKTSPTLSKETLDGLCDAELEKLNLPGRALLSTNKRTRNCYYRFLSLSQVTKQKQTFFLRITPALETK